MKMTCTSCGESFEAKRPSAKYCSERCKKRAQRGQRVVNLPGAPPAPVVGRVEAAAAARLAEVEREDTPVGQAVLALARRIDQGYDTGAGLASLVKQFEASLKSATAGAETEVSPVDQMRDELAARRAARGA